jgi:hypothetical protein
MNATRAALADLVDENRPVAERMLSATGIKGMGKGIITAILHVAYPKKYGVWNNTSHEGLVELGLFPDIPRGASFGERYAAVNNVLTLLADELQIDLWTLDTLWWYLWSDEDDEEEGQNSNIRIANAMSIEAAPKASRFALERHLHDYMFDNWDVLDLAQEWDISAAMANLRRDTSSEPQSDELTSWLATNGTLDGL